MEAPDILQGLRAATVQQRRTLLPLEITNRPTRRSLESLSVRPLYEVCRVPLPVSSETVTWPSRGSRADSSSGTLCTGPLPARG